MKMLETTTTNVTRLNPHATADTLSRFFMQEKEYLDSLTREPPAETFAIDYIDLLERLYAKECVIALIYQYTVELTEVTQG